MSYEFNTYGDLADFLERLLRGQMRDRWEIDDFESTMLARKEGQPKWALELWRRAAIDVATAIPSENLGRWMHPDARPYVQRLIEILRYLDEHIDSETGFSK